VLALAGLALGALWAENRRRSWAVVVASVAAFFVIPIYGKVTNYPALHIAVLDELCAWARLSAPKSAVFLFPDAGRELQPGVFRAEALRTVYVDWKSGGQVNYFKDFGEQWWSRWQDVMAKPGDPSKLAAARQRGDLRKRPREDEERAARAEEEIHRLEAIEQV